MISILFVFALAFGFQEPTTEAEDPFPAARAAASATLVAELLELAAWCEEAKLFLARDECHLAVLRLAPDDAQARKALGYKAEEGGWREPKNRKPPRNHDPKALEEYATRREAALDRHRDALLAALRPAEGVPAFERTASVRDELFALDPDDPDTRAYFGETRLEDAWVLVETVRGKDRRPELNEMVRVAYESLTPPREVAPNEREKALGIEFQAALETDWGRVLGSGERAEVDAVTRALGGALAYFRAALGNDASYYDGATVFVLAKPGDKQSFLDRHPAIQGTYKEFLASIMGSGIQGSSDIADWATDPKMRLDGIVRIALGWLLYQSYGITGDAGWVYEGLGLYMTRELVGTRLTWSAQPSEYMKPREEAAMRSRLLDPNCNWMNEAHKLFQKGRAPHLRFVMGKKITGLTTEDMLVSYVAAAYLLEGRPEDAPALLAKIGAGVPSQQAVEQALGIDVMQLHERVVRWLGERK